MNVRKAAWLFFLLTTSMATAFSQNDTLAVADTLPKPGLPADTLPAVRQVAIFAPLYLDSAFDQNLQYRYDQQWPRFLSPGIEFWEGIQLAIDSMDKEGVKMEVHLYDTRSAKESLRDILQREEIKKMDLFIGEVNGSEARLLADAAARQSISFVNVNYPNDAGVTNNPGYIILNSTLETHCAGIYKFMQKNYALSPIVMFTRQGGKDARLISYLDSAAASTSSVPLKIQTVVLPDAFTPADLAKELDSNTTSIVLAGSLDLGFAQHLVQDLAGLSNTFHCVIMGMPTWDLIDFNRPQYKGTDLIYSTPFYYDPADKMVMQVADYCRKNYFMRPTEMVFRGYETLYHFGHLLFNSDSGVARQQASRFRLFTQFDIEPILSRPDFRLEYFENKKLYYIRKVDGQIKTVY